MWRICCAFVAMLGLVACQTMPKPTQFSQQSFMSRQHELASISHWAFSGKFSIHVKQTDTGSIHWQQTQQGYSIHIFGPMHMGSVKLEGNPQQVTLWRKVDESVTDTNVEHLLLKEFNWQLPVSALPYWVLGRLRPNAPAQKKLDAYNHIRWLKQQGWEVTLSDYTTIEGIDLPTRFELVNGGMKVKLIIKEWAVD